MNGIGAGIDVALWIDVMVKRSLSQSAINQLNTANLNHAIARCWIETSGFSIEYHLTHYVVPSRSSGLMFSGPLPAY